MGNLIPWMNNSIQFNPYCNDCVYRSYGEGCNNPQMDPSAFFICEQDIVDRADLVVNCMSCKEGIDSLGEAFSLANPLDNNSVKWLHHSCWKPTEMGVYIYSKF